MDNLKQAHIEDARGSILVIDDSPEIIGIITSLLGHDYQIKTASSGELALQMLASGPMPDIILLDILMPEMDGYEVCRRLKANLLTRDIPVIFLSTMQDDSDIEKCFAVGAVDYLNKPIHGVVMLSRVKTHYNLNLVANFAKDKNQFLVIEVAKRAKELEFIQDVTILAMASLAETRDNETGNHLRRTQHYVLALAEQLRHHPKFSLVLTRPNIELIFKSAPLHDIGKVGIPDAILLKPGKLTAVEFELMKTHAALGYIAIENAEKTIGRSAPFLKFAKEITGSHHEKWDGSGYPEGLAGEDIPISARLMALADVYDALVSARPYKKPMSHEDSAKIIIEHSGQHFDPDIVNAFISLQDKFKAIAHQFSDNQIYGYAD